MSDVVLNPKMLEYYNRNDKIANDLPVYSYPRLLELAGKKKWPSVPFPVYFATNELRLALPEAFKDAVTLRDEVTFTSDVQTVTNQRLAVPQYSAKGWDRITACLRKKVQETGELEDLLEKVENRQPLEPYVIAFDEDELGEVFLNEEPNVLFDLPDGGKNWPHYLHSVYQCGAHYTFNVDWERASRPDRWGNVRYRVLTPEEALALDGAWRTGMKQKGLQQFLKDMNALALTEEEKTFVKNLKAKIDMLRCW